MYIFWRLEFQLHTIYQLIRLQKHCALHHFLISDSQSIKSSGSPKWISVLNFCILKTVFSRPLIDKIDTIWWQFKTPSKTNWKPKQTYYLLWQKTFYSVFSDLQNSEGSFTFIYLCFVSLHKAVKYVQYRYVFYILIASFQKTWMGLLETIFTQSDTICPSEKKDSNLFLDP